MKPKYFLKENKISYLEIKRVSYHVFSRRLRHTSKKNVTAFRKKSINKIGSVREDE